MYHHLFGNTRDLWRPLFANSAFLILNTLAGSFLGFLFWVLATHRYSPAQVGSGSAYIAAMTLLTSLGDMGLGIALIRFAPSMGSRGVDFVNASITMVTSSTFILTLVFVIGIPIWSPEMNTLTHSRLHLGLFMGATLAFSLAQFLDRLYVAFQVTHFALIRNLLANTLRIGVAMMLGNQLGAAALVLAVGAGALGTLGLSALVLAPRALPGYRARPCFDCSLVAERLPYSLGNHFSLLLWNAPPLIYPLVIVTMLGAEANACFYVAWMIANMLFIVPTAVSTSAFAHAANHADVNGRAFWYTMRLTLIGLLPIALGVMLASKPLLQMFGQEYMTAGRTLLMLLVISVFPYTLNTFVIVDYRIRQNVRGVIWVSGFIALLSLTLVVAGGTIYALPGIGIGWVGGQTLGAVFALLNHRHNAQAAHASRPARSSRVLQNE
jgi:O-antigen/teichoic acid export membrane protein